MQLRWQGTAALLIAIAGVACTKGGERGAVDSGRAAAGADTGKAISLHVEGPLDYTPPPDSLIPNDELGASIRRGLALITHTTDSLPQYATGSLQCSSCHIDAGRRRDAAGLLGVHARFPKYMDRTGAVIPLADRVNYCFTRSLAGNRIPTDSREMQDIIAYLAYI